MLGKSLWIAAAGGMFCAAAMAQQTTPAPARAARPGGVAATARPQGGYGEDRPTQTQLLRRSGGSLMQATPSVAPETAKAQYAALSLTAVPDPEPRTMKKHNLVTIIIREESEISSDAKTDLKKSADFNSSVDQFIKLQLNNFAIKGGAQGPTPPNIALSGDRSFTGEGKADRNDSFTTRITAEVVDVRPNGTFVVQASKYIKHDDEEQEYVVTGVCRGEDVTADNTIFSWQIADQRIQTKHDGAVSDTSKRGWIPKLLDFINPF